MIIQRRLFVLHCILSILETNEKIDNDKMYSRLMLQNYTCKMENHLTVDKQAERAFT